MAVRTGKREQLSVGIVIMILAIAAIDWFIFRDPRSRLRQANKDWQGAKMERMAAEEIFQKPDNFINPENYDRRTRDYQKRYLELVKLLDLEQDPIYRKDYSELKDDKEREAALLKASNTRRVALHDALLKLLKFRKANDKKINLAFLGPTGWDFPTALPPELLRSNASGLIDRLDAIESTIAILNEIDNPETERRKRWQLFEAMRELLIEVNTLGQIHFQRENHPMTRRPGGPGGFGQIVPILKIMVHLELFDEGAKLYKGYDFNKRGFLESFIQHVKREDIDLNYPIPQWMHSYTRQLEVLEEVLGLAVKHQVKEVHAVHLYQTERVDLLEEPETPAGSAPASGGGGGVAPAPSATVAGGGGGGAAPAPVAATGKLRETLKFAPMRIRFTADNANLWRFLWELSHSKRLYEIENLSLQQNPDPDQKNTITADVYLGVLTYVGTLSEKDEPVKTPVKSGASPTTAGQSPDPTGPNDNL